MYHGDGCGKTRLHDASCTITQWSSLTHNRALHQKLARSLRESKVQFVVEGIWSFLEKAGGQDGRLHPPQLEQTTAVVVAPSAVVPFRSIRGLYSILPTSILVSAQIWITQHAMQKKTLTDAIERKKNRVRDSFLATYFLLPLTMSTCGKAGSDVNALIKELAIRRAEHKSKIHSNTSRHLAQ